LLQNPIYTGTYVFGRFCEQRGRSVVWGKFAGDNDGGYRDFVLDVPELAYWEPARVRRWQRKFIRRGEIHPRLRRFPHPLSGILHCVNCGDPMIGGGEDVYVCRASNSGGTLASGRVCLRPQWLTGYISTTLLRTVLPEVMFSAQELAGEALRQSKDRVPSAAERRLAYLEERAGRMADDYLEMDVPSDALKAKLQETQREINQLREQVTSEQDAQFADEAMAGSLQLLADQPMQLFDTLPVEKQTQIYRLLFRDVRISCTGRGAGRQWRIAQYTPAFGKGPVDVIDDSAIVRLPNPAHSRRGTGNWAPIVVQSAQSRVIHSCSWP
jgi:hypothetical protein